MLWGSKILFSKGQKNLTLVRSSAQCVLCSVYVHFFFLLNLCLCVLANSVKKKKTFLTHVAACFAQNIVENIWFHFQYQSNLKGKVLVRFFNPQNHSWVSQKGKNPPSGSLCGQATVFRKETKNVTLLPSPFWDNLLLGQNRLPLGGIVSRHETQERGEW